MSRGQSDGSRRTYGSAAVEMACLRKGSPTLPQLADQLQQAARMYAASQTQTRRVGMLWPSQSFSGELLEQTQASLSEEGWARAWQEGTRLTLEDVAHSPGISVTLDS